MGTWETQGYSESKFITFTLPDVEGSCELKAKWVFTEDTYQAWLEVKNSSISGMEDGVDNDGAPRNLYGVDEEHYYTSERTNDGRPDSGSPIDYTLKDGALYVLGYGPMYKVR